MKLTYILAVAVYIFFFIRNKNSKSFITELMLFLVIAAPGLQISGVLVNPIDIVSPVIFIWVLFFRSSKIQFTRTEKAYLLFLIIIAISVLLNFNAYQSIFVPLLQVFRLFEVLFVVTIFKKCYNGISSAEILNSVNVYGIVLCLISCVSFFEQDTIYNAGQIITSGPLNGYARAGGVFGEASYFGFMTVILFLTGVYALKNSKISYKINAVIVITLSIICNVLSYTRISNISLIIALIFVLLRRITLKKLCFIAGACVVFLIVVTQSKFLYSFIFERMLKTLDFSNGFNTISSGRLDVWQAALNKFFESNRFFFGIGYKNNTLADNMFLMSLTQMGICGLLSFLIVLVTMGSQVIKKRESFCVLLFFNVVLMSITCDVFTYSRPLSLMFILFLIYETPKSVNICNNHKKKLITETLS